MGVFVMMTRAGVRTEARKIENGAHGPNAHEDYRPSADKVRRHLLSAPTQPCEAICGVTRGLWSHDGTDCECLTDPNGAL